MHASARPRVYRHLSTLLSPSARAQSHAKIASNEKPLPISIQSGLCQLRPARLAVSPFPPPPSACLFLDTHTSVSLCYPYFTSRASHHACLFPLLFSPAPATFHFTSLPACACLFGCLSCPSSSRAPDQVSRELMRQPHPHVLAITR